MDAHRAAWLIYVGPVPDGLNVLHLCNNPPCVRIGHLYLGTPKDNVRDMDAAGRAKRPKLPGDRNPAAKLSSADVLSIRALREAGETILSIANAFHISYSHTKRILNRTNWR